jgi:aminopeptidase-like protein
MAILSGLDLAAVFRLKQTWAKLEEEKPKVIQKYRTLQALLSQEENNKTYRNLIASVKPPGIPYIGMFGLLSSFSRVRQKIFAALDEGHLLIVSFVPRLQPCI